jgi:arylsulfatase
MPDSRPNILLVMTDQQRGDCLGVEGHPVLQTPNMDAIAHHGVRFRRAYSTCPVCIPARRSLMSGQFPATHGLIGYRDGLEWNPPATLPDELRKAGYQTAIVGRSMHLHPLRRRYGFEEMIISGGWLGEGEYERFLAEHGPVGGGGYYGGGVMHNDRTARPWHLAEHLHHTHWTVEQSLRWLQRRDPSCPFFLVMSFLAPHPPLNPPAFYMERYLAAGAGVGADEPAVGDWAQEPPVGEHDHGRGMAVDSPRVRLCGEELRRCRAGYYGLINHIDDQIRRVLNPVTGPDNTICLFTSDHGEMLGDHHLFRKSQPYEGAARVPLLWRYRGAPAGEDFAAGSVVDVPVCLEDIMPTCLELAGVEIPSSVEGRSLVPLLRGRIDDGWPRPFVHGEYANLGHYLTDGRMKYIWFSGDGREQLFDLVADPKELRDLSASPQHAAALEQWRQRLVEHLRDRPEGFTDGTRLVAGRHHASVLPHARPTEA